MQEEAKRQLRNSALFADFSPSELLLDNFYSKKKDLYSGRQHTYLEDETGKFVQSHAKYANNYYAAKVQGSFPGNFDSTRGAYIRTMDLVEETTGGKMPNDWQLVYFQDPKIKGLYLGAKMWFGGNVWLSTAPYNVADSSAKSIIRRCNAVWKHLDYYGNVKAEPFVWANGPAQATAHEYLDYSVIPNEYQKCVMQLNEETKEIAINRRMILGSSAFEVRGLVDFISDFTDAPHEDGTEGGGEPVHILFFDLQYQQPLDIDDMERGIAGGKEFKWEIFVSQIPAMHRGETAQIEAYSKRNGKEPDDENHPYSYVFTSLDENVLTVDENGVLTAIGNGTCGIVVSLKENPAISATVTVDVIEAIGLYPHVGLHPSEDLYPKDGTSTEFPPPQWEFNPPVPHVLKQLQSYTGHVYCKSYGQRSTEIEITFEGNTTDCTAEKNGNTFTVQAWRPSDVPLAITFKDTKTGDVRRFVIELEAF